MWLLFLGVDVVLGLLILFWEFLFFSEIFVCNFRFLVEIFERKRSRVRVVMGLDFLF